MMAGGVMTGGVMTGGVMTGGVMNKDLAKGRCVETKQNMALREICRYWRDNDLNHGIPVSEMPKYSRRRFKRIA